MRAEDELLVIAAEVAACTKCPLHRNRTRTVPGEGPAGAAVMLVGEAPGRKEDEEGRPFVGSAGKNLERLLANAGLKREEVFITNVVKCRPPGNRRPKASEAESCHPYLRRQTDAISPKVVVLLGDTALKQFFPESSLASVHGKAMRRGSTTYFSTYHPASLIYNRSLEEVISADLSLLGKLLGAVG
jgi:uracil-DNA glycosylase